MRKKFSHLQPGDKFGKLTVIETYVAPYKGKNRRYAKCSCDCGSDKVVDVVVGSLRSGNTKSCGCLRKLYTYEGETKNLKEWFKDSRCKVGYRTLVSRINSDEY